MGKRIFVTGGTGYLGRLVCARLAASGSRVEVLTRNPDRAPLGENIFLHLGDPSEPGRWMEIVSHCDGAVNLAGEPVNGRLTPEKKNAIRLSRLDATRNLAAAVPAGRLFTLVSASAMGYYGDGGLDILGEDAPQGRGFFAETARDWEKEALAASAKGARVAVMRLGLVFGPDGGPWPEMVRAARKFNILPPGGDRRYISWIHEEDFSRAVEFILENPSLSGPVNVSSPNPVTQAECAVKLGVDPRNRNQIPGLRLALRVLLGEFADNLNHSQRMAPAKLVRAGFVFNHPLLNPDQG